MTIEIKKNQEETIIEIVGRLDTITAPALDKTINEDIGDTKNLVLDVKGMEYISSAGLRVLLAAQKKMQKIGSMKVMNVCEEVMEVFEMTGFADILVIE
jgi:anti-sigma B factor antagonist